MEAVYSVGGMTCGGCAASVKKALERLGVEVEVSLDRGQATLKGPVRVGSSPPGPADERAVREALETAGFTFGGRA